MRIQADNRADALAKQGFDMHPDNAERRNECDNDVRVHTHILKYMARCLLYALERDCYKEIQDQHFEIVANAVHKFDPASLANKHFLTHIRDGAIRARCVKCYSPSTGAVRHGSCKGDAWAKGHRLLEVGNDLIFCGRCGAYSVGRVNHLYNLCPGAPWSATARNAKNRLHEGLHPVSGVFLGVPVPLVRFFKQQPAIDLEVENAF